jgi:phosphotransferase system enzyme I (PtsI)
MTFVLHGLGVSRGVAIGRAVRLDDGHYEVPRRQVGRAERAAECARLDHATATVHREFDLFKRHIPNDAPTEISALLGVHAMILDDPALTEKPRALILERGMNAEWALSETADDLVAIFEAMDDAYLRERKHDVMQVVGRLRKALAGASPATESQPTQANSDPADALQSDAMRVLVANDLAPADMLQFRATGQGEAQRNTVAFCTEVGGRTSHTAILARSMNVPAVVGVHEASQWINDGDWLIIDGEAGAVIVSPDESVLAAYRKRLDEQRAAQRVLAGSRLRPAITRDGREISLEANIELPDDAIAAMQANASAVGLFRSEFLFMNRGELPGEDEQYEAYRRTVEAMQGRPVTIRTLDIGADKALQSEDARPTLGTENPALGLRAIRYSLSEPEMFRTQLRAMLRAATHGPVRILVPMLSTAAEIDATLGHIQQARIELVERGDAVPPPVPVGGMIEIPAAALAIRAFTQKLDFLSIGTNDLIQYTLAIDRTDADVADLYDPLHPAVLGLIALTIRAGEQAGIDVAVCGEMAGDAQLTRLLLGMGLRHFSMQAAQIPYVKAEILGTRFDEAQQLAAQALEQYDARAIRELLRANQSPGSA